VCVAGLTFELRGARRRDALAAKRMMHHAASRPARLAGERPLERRVRHHSAHTTRRIHRGLLPSVQPLAAMQALKALA
jgi:hypothetical protein